MLFSAMDLTIKKIEKNNNNKRKHILTKKDESSWKDLKSKNIKGEIRYIPTAENIEM